MIRCTYGGMLIRLPKQNNAFTSTADVISTFIGSKTRLTIAVPWCVSECCAIGVAEMVETLARLAAPPSRASLFGGGSSAVVLSRH